MPGKIIEKIQKKIQDQEPFFSLEFFPPRTIDGGINLISRLDRMAKGGPLFVDVTWGAGGGNPSKIDLAKPTSSLAVAHAAINYCGLDTMLHLTCVGSTKEELLQVLHSAKTQGIRNILALRGDLPEEPSPKKNQFSHAVELVQYIRSEFGDYFGICVAGYPNGHPDCKDPENDIKYLKEKVDSGADFIITQLFFDVETFIKFRQRCREVGIHCPIIPGILPIQSADSLRHLTKLSKLKPPDMIVERVNQMKDDDKAIREFGVEISTRMCSALLEAGAPGLHFYTLNREVAVMEILSNLGLWNLKKAKQLPWLCSANDKRAAEDVRPIFWQSRPKSYLIRTQDWDDFPNGRWGDSSSAAFGDLKDYYLFTTKRPTKQEKLRMWGYPQTVQDVGEVFVRFITGQGGVTCLPWVEESELTPETTRTPLLHDLVRLNRNGILTTNSQPAVNGLPSSHEVYGWGGPGGFVFQKCYLEFFVSPEVFLVLLEALKTFPMMTFYAMNVDGSITKSNITTNEPNAVTWGVFPGKEIIQPTVVDPVSFPIWKDEAFALWEEWTSLYDRDSTSRRVIDSIRSTYLLVNIVDNNFVNCQMFEMFELVLSHIVNRV